MPGRKFTPEESHLVLRAIRGEQTINGTASEHFPAVLYALLCLYAGRSFVDNVLVEIAVLVIYAVLLAIGHRAARGGMPRNTPMHQDNVDNFADLAVLLFLQETDGVCQRPDQGTN